MLGWRGAPPLLQRGLPDGFALECRAIRRVRERMGFTNVLIMIPFCRTPAEADKVLEVLAQNGLQRGKKRPGSLRHGRNPDQYPGSRGFAERFDGFSIGSNDLTQLVLGISRDSEKLADLFDESEANRSSG
jgi:pyruvate, water dikinase